MSIYLIKDFSLKIIPNQNFDDFILNLIKIDTDDLNENILSIVHKQSSNKIKADVFEHNTQFLNENEYSLLHKMEINEVDISKYLKIQEFPLKKHKMDIHKAVHITMSDSTKFK